MKPDHDTLDYRALFERCPEALVAVDARGTVLAANPAAAALLGRPAAELPGRPVASLISGLPVEPGPLPAESAGPALCALRDARERRDSEAESRRRAQEQEQRIGDGANALHAANRELEAFCYSVSHDLRQPLRALNGFSTALLEDYADRLDQTGRDYLGRIQAAAGRMSQLIDDLLRLSRVSRGELRYEEVDLSAVARELMAELRALEPGRSVSVEIEDRLRVRGDAALLRIALGNLLANAWKFTSKKEACRVSLRSPEPGVFCVEDDGAGFDMAYADQLFVAFQRLHSAHEFPGIGIGLAIVQRVVSRLGGEVWALSRPGEGARFYFRLGLPAREAAP